MLTSCLLHLTPTEKKTKQDSPGKYPQSTRISPRRHGGLVLEYQLFTNFFRRSSSRVIYIYLYHQISFFKFSFIQAYIDHFASLLLIFIQKKKVMATVRPRSYPLPPKYPNNIRVNATIKTPCSSSAGTRNATISWLPVTTTEELTYCVFVNPTNGTDNLYNSTDTFYTLLKQTPKHRKCTLLPPWNKT